MDLKSLISGIVSEVVFPTVDGFLDDIVLTTGTESYDPATRTVGPSAALPAVKCAVTQYNFKERMDANGKISTEDRKALIQSLDLPQRPNAATKATIKGVVYEVRGVEASIGEVLWIVQMRKA